MLNYKTDPNDPYFGSETRNGVTIREEYIKAAMQGLCANPRIIEIVDSSKSTIQAVISEMACAIADKTIERINQSPDEQ